MRLADLIGFWCDTNLSSLEQQRKLKKLRVFCLMLLREQLAMLKSHPVHGMEEILLLVVMVELGPSGMDEISHCIALVK